MKKHFCSLTMVVFLVGLTSLAVGQSYTIPQVDLNATTYFYKHWNDDSIIDETARTTVNGWVSYEFYASGAGEAKAGIQDNYWPGNMEISNMPPGDTGSGDLTGFDSYSLVFHNPNDTPIHVNVHMNTGLTGWGEPNLWYEGGWTWMDPNDTVIVTLDFTAAGVVYLNHVTNIGFQVAFHDELGGWGEGTGTLYLDVAPLGCDGDLDGYVSDLDPGGLCPGGDDCDDGDGDINPGAAEVCDGVDNDCDGTTDEDPEASDSCDNGLYCDGEEYCDGGSCQAGTEVDCSYLDDQCNEGVCDEGSDQCVAQAANEGGSCDDGQYCTVGETCTDGVCGGGSPRDCSYLDDQCNEGVCDEGSDQCVAQAANEGMTCDDGNACLVDETCQSGACTGGAPPDCSGAGDQCNAASCNPAGSEGNCDTQAPANEGGSCDDGNACLVGETCQSGSCTGGAPPDCSAAGGDCGDASCNPAGYEGNCDTLTPVNEGQPCYDGDPCTTDDSCSNGICTGDPLDADGDTHVSLACGGWDCVDDPADDPAGCDACECGGPECAGCARCINPDARDLPGDPYDSNCNGIGDCFIATASYGTEMAGKIEVIRAFRDRFLLTNPLGKSLMGAYYKYGPMAAEYIVDRPWLRKAVRILLLPVIGLVSLLV